MDYIEFGSTNIEETKKFYSEVFDWEFTDYGPDYTSFSDGRLAGGFSIAPDVQAGGPSWWNILLPMDRLPERPAQY